MMKKRAAMATAKRMRVFFGMLNMTITGVNVLMTDPYLAKKFLGASDSEQEQEPIRN